MSLPSRRGGLKLIDPATGSRFATPPKLLSGGGGLTSTTADYLRFCHMLRNKGILDGQRVLGRKTVEFMTGNHLPGSMADMGQPRFNNGHMGAGLGFGLGFAVVLDPALAQTQGSTGEYYWTGLANTQFWIDPSEELIVIQMAQLIPSSLLPLRRELRSLVSQALVD
ncbi:serine hydrolase [Salinicola salarius]|uniref:serine hydrolase n=1 Tax=Salinicola salarius TaxID=430457 RepID=UPI00211B49CA|nr:serine hydrolase [Salinicola salarius]